MNKKVFVIYFVFLSFKVLYCETTVNDRPIIGVITEEFTENPSLEKGFIMAPYVKYIEASGARVVPIQIYKSKEYYRDIMSKINGVLIPGGNDLLKTKGFGRTGKLIFDIAVEMNEKGDYFPLWGTCLGFELLNFAAVEKSWMKLCTADDWATNIDFADGYQYSRLFSKLPDDLKTIMESETVAIHFHHWCITPQNYSISGLDKYFKVLATNKDSSGETFVSIIEAFDYPFYAVTFHPEKVVFDWSPQNISTPHTAHVIRVSQYFSNFFADEARKNLNHFPSKFEEDSLLIYNYSPKLSGDDRSCQMYVFQ